MTIENDLNRWYALSKELVELKAKEMELRKKIFAAYFENPVEGTNKSPLANGFHLLGKYPITRTVDQALLKVNMEHLRAKHINVDDIIRWKPELVIGAYRKLTQEQIHALDQCLDIKAGSPSLEIVFPKEAK